MTPNQREWSLARDGLAAAVASLGYPEELGDLLAKELGSPKAIERMTSWLYHEKPKDMELIVDEMLAIREEIEAWRKKAEGRERVVVGGLWTASAGLTRVPDLMPGTGLILDRIGEGMESRSTAVSAAN